MVRTHAVATGLQECKGSFCTTYVVSQSDNIQQGKHQEYLELKSDERARIIEPLRVASREKFKSKNTSAPAGSMVPDAAKCIVDYMGRVADSATAHHDSICLILISGTKHDIGAKLQDGFDRYEPLVYASTTPTQYFDADSCTDIEVPTIVQPGRVRTTTHVTPNTV